MYITVHIIVNVQYIPGSVAGSLISTAAKGS